MILVDTSVWVDHLRQRDAQMAALLESDRVMVHPFVIGELACSSWRDRATVLGALRHMPPCAVADVDEVAGFIERHRLYGQGIGYVDIHLLAAVALTHGATLWTRDKRLLAAAQSLGCAHSPSAAH